MKAAGVYAIVSPAGLYVGSATSMARRFREHRSALSRGIHKNGRLQRAWNRHGGAQFRFEPRIVCSPENLLVYEQAAINALRPGLNVCLVAGNSLGVTRSPEYRAAKSAANRGKTLTAEHRAKISAGLTGRPVSEETRVKLAAQKGWKHTDEARAKMRGPRPRRPE